MLSYRSKLSLNPRICLESDTAVKFTPVVSFTHPVSSLAVPCHPSGYLHKIGKEWKALHSPLFLLFNSALQWTPPALQVLAQLVSLFALGC